MSQIQGEPKADEQKAEDVKDDRPIENIVGELRRKNEKLAQDLQNVLTRVDGLASENERLKGAVAPKTEEERRQELLSLLVPKAKDGDADPLAELGERPDAVLYPEAAREWEDRRTELLIQRATQTTKKETLDAVEEYTKNRDARNEYKTANFQAQSAFEKAYSQFYGQSIPKADLDSFAKHVNTTYKGKGPLGAYTGQQLWDAWRSYREDDFRARDFAEGKADAIRDINRIGEAMSRVPGYTPSSQRMTVGDILKLPAKDIVDKMHQTTQDGWKKIYDAADPQVQQSIRKEIHDRQALARANLGLD